MSHILALIPFRKVRRTDCPVSTTARVTRSEIARIFASDLGYAV